jgi:hypothetical protein
MDFSPSEDEAAVAALVVDLVIATAASIVRRVAAV